MLASTGLCQAPSIPAELLESHVVDHVEAFIDSTRTWLVEQVQERDAERAQKAAAVDRLRRDLADYERALLEGEKNARIVLEVVARLVRERDGLQEQIASAEKLVVDAGDAGVDQALELCGQIAAVVRKRIREATDVKALRERIAGICVGIRDDRLHAEFELRPPDGRPASHEAAVHLLRHAHPVGLEARRFTLAEPDAIPSSAGR